MQGSNTDIFAIGALSPGFWEWPPALTMVADNQVNHKSRFSKMSHMRFIWAVFTVLLAGLVLEKQSLAANSGAAAGAPNPPCAAITEPEARLRCYDKLEPDPKQQNLSDSQAMSGWRLVRTPGLEGSQSVSITRTADGLHSDPGLAGLSLHCGQNGPEMLIVVVLPFAPRSQPKVKIGGRENMVEYDASVLPSGAVLQLPKGAIALADGQWQQLADLVVEIKDRDTTIRGVVPVTGLGDALKTLKTYCPS